MWFRRDLRLGDRSALLAARDGADEVLPVFVLDDRLRGPVGVARLTFLHRCLRDLSERLGGAYVRRHVPELRNVVGPAVHEPWRLPGGPPNGYPAPIVDHRAERAEALRRYEQARR